MSDLVTGDAVVVELRLARLASRSLAFAIDLALMVTAFVLLLAVTAATGTLDSVDDALAAAVALVVTLAVFVAYPVTIETLTRGRSVGKMALGLRVVREDGGPIRFRQALARGLAGFVIDFGVLSGFTGTVALFSSLLSARGRRVGDMLAGTVVVRERMPATHAVEVAMPPPLAAWAAGTTLSALPDALALSARQFLSRAADLDPRIRASLGADLAERVAAHVGPAPPPGTPAEAFLAAVLAERRRRESLRLAARGVGRSVARAASTSMPGVPGPAGPGSPRPSGPTGAGRTPDPGAPDGGFAPPR